MTLYLKYRSQTLDELDLKEVRESLKNIVSSGNIPHALIFSGPKGSGKTSAARILAKVVNCLKPNKDGEPCNKCEQCRSIARGESLDILELDAASHRGIDDIRALREAVKLAPASAKKKVYIIDEAHMLTVEASNALLKTLEEPPNHVMFILATTNPEKLIETIRSRATNILFKRAKTQELVRALERVVNGEKLKVGVGVLEAIAKASDGSFRDAIKILEQLILEGIKLDKQEVEEFLFQRRTFNADDFILILSQRNVKRALSEIEKAINQGISAKNLSIHLIERLRNALMNKIGLEGEDIESLDKNEIVYLIKLISDAVSDMSLSILEQIPLELAIVEWCQIKADRVLGDKVEIKNHPGMYEDDKSQIRISKHKEIPPVKASELSSSDKENLGSFKNGFDEGIWASVLTQIRPKNASTEALLRASKPVDFDGRVLTLGVYYSFHKERLEAPPHRDILEEAISSIIGERIKVHCTLTQAPEKNTVKETLGESSSDSHQVVLTEGSDEDIIKVAKEIFGG